MCTNQHSIGSMGPVEIIEIAPASSGANSPKRPSSDSGSQAESAPGPSKRVRVDDCASKHSYVLLRPLTSFLLVAATQSAPYICVSAHREGIQGQRSRRGRYRESDFFRIPAVGTPEIYIYSEYFVICSNTLSQLAKYNY